MFLEAVAKTGHEKTLRSGRESQNAQRSHGGYIRGMRTSFGLFFKQTEQGPIGRGGRSSCALLPSSLIELKERGRSCATSVCLCLLLPGLSHRFKSGYGFAENPYP